MTLILHTPSGDLPVTRATDTQANVALASWLYERYIAGCIDPTPCVLQAVVLPPMEFEGETIRDVAVLVDADMVSERPRPPMRPRLALV